MESDAEIADVGSGTGKFTELLLARGFSVSGVEPNKEMREAAEALLASYGGFKSCAGQSESTGLSDASVDLITAAQAFHWFDVEKARSEFERILKPGARIALIWNQRDTDDEFQREYDDMLTRYAPEYTQVNHRNISEADIAAFYQPRAMQLFTFNYSQQFGLTGFLGRMKSSSYTPKQGTSELGVLTAVAEELFAKHGKAGVVNFTYQSNLYLA